MAKKKKTREQKILADKRREASDLPLYSLPVEHQKKQIEQPAIQAKQHVLVVTTNYNYLSSDLFKTVLFTGSIVVAELALKFFLK